MQKKQDIKIEKNQDVEIEKSKKEIEELTNKWKRAVADYQNLEKRVMAEKAEFIRFSSKNLIEKLLGIIDDLEKAQNHLQDEGLGLTLKKIAELLKNEGVEKIDTKGKDFDISKMEAVAQVDGETDNKVMEETRSGYLMHGSVIRPAQVTVSRKK